MKKLLFLLATTATGAALFGQGQLPIETETLDQLAARMWQDPEFKKSFIESNLPLIDKEPDFSNEEKIVIKEELLTFFENQQFNLAIPKLQELAAKPTASAQIDFILGNLFLQSNRTAQAEKSYAAAVKKFPTFQKAWKNLALIHMSNGNHDKALEPLGKALALGDVSSATYGMLGVCYMQKNNYLAAESAFRNALLLDPEDKNWKLNLFQTMMIQERYREANALLQPMIQAEPNNADYWKYQANIYLGLERPLEAAEVLEIRDRMGKSDGQSLDMLGRIYYSEQLFDVAFDVYQRAIKANGARFDSLYESANALAAVGNYENCLSLIEQLRNRFATSIEKEENLDLLVLEAGCLRALGDSEKAAEILEKIVVEDPMNGGALIELGLYYKNLEVPDYAKAIDMFERAQNVTEFAAKACVEHGTLLVKQRKYREAASLLRQAQAIDYKENIQTYLDRVERAMRSSR